MKKLNTKVMTLIASILTIFATSVASGACYWTLYQPKEPKCLREE